MLADFSFLPESRMLGVRSLENIVSPNPPSTCPWVLCLEYSTSVHFRVVLALLESAVAVVWCFLPPVSKGKPLTTLPGSNTLEVLRDDDDDDDNVVL